MCDPVSIAYAAVAAVSIVAQDQQAEAQAEKTNARFEQNQLNATASMRNEYQQTQTRQGQEQIAASQKTQNRRRQEMQDRATASVAMGEAGIQGFTVDSILRDISGVADRDVTNINQNRDWNVGQMSSQMAGIQGNTKGRINSAPRDAGPSSAATALKIGGAAMNSYTGYMGRTGNDPIGDAFSSGSKAYGADNLNQGLPSRTNKLQRIQ
jgi:hypothetical protein